MANRQQQLEQTLDTVLEQQEGVLGMALVSRDGIPVLSRFTRQFDQKAFSILVESAMVATLSGAAEEAMAELEGGTVERITIQASELHMTVVGVSDDLLLVAMTDADLPHERLDEILRSARNSLTDLA